jgi:PAS domain S-box-containing protein
MMVKKTIPSSVRGEYLRARVEEFGEELAASMGREALLHSAEALRHDPGLIAETADRLRLQHEQLLVADEELRAQMLELDEISQRLAHERKRYQELFQFAPDPMFYTDRAGTIRDANPAATKLLSIEHHFLMGKPLVAFVERGDVTRFRELTNRIANAGPSEMKVVMQARTGATEEVLLRGQVFEERHHIVWAARRIDDRFTVKERLSLPPRRAIPENLAISSWPSDLTARTSSRPSCDGATSSWTASAGAAVRSRQPARQKIALSQWSRTSCAAPSTSSWAGRTSCAPAI